MKLCGLCIMTNDVTSLSDFYKIVFDKTPEGDEKHLTFREEQLALWHPDKFDNNSQKSISIMYYVDDVDKVYKRLKTYNEFSQLSEPVLKPWGVKALSLKDPDGNVIDLLEVILNG